MKYFTALSIALLTAGCALAQTDAAKYEWKATLKAVDESGNPISGANAQIGYYANSLPVNAEGITDTNGIFMASHSALASMVEVSCQAEKPGYYTTWVRRELGPKYDPAQWTFTQTLLLKKIERPIPMYVKRVETKIQKENEPVGFDLTSGDWVAPYGTGKITDLLFTVRRKINSDKDYSAELKLTFPNKGDGIAVAPPEPETGSEFKTPRTAAESGYDAERVWHYSSSSGPQVVPGYFLRVRTERDQNGNIKSALYGKIPGDFRFYAGTKAPRAGMGFNYYLNPTPNDRNLEFDLKHNLLQGLEFDEQIREP